MKLSIVQINKIGQGIKNLWPNRYLVTEYLLQQLRILGLDPSAYGAYLVETVADADTPFDCLMALKTIASRLEPAKTA